MRERVALLERLITIWSVFIQNDQMQLSLIDVYDCDILLLLERGVFEAASILKEEVIVRGWWY